MNKSTFIDAVTDRTRALREKIWTWFETVRSRDDFFNCPLPEGLGTADGRIIARLCSKLKSFTVPVTFLVVTDDAKLLFAVSFLAERLGKRAAQVVALDARSYIFLQQQEVRVRTNRLPNAHAKIFGGGLMLPRIGGGFFLPQLSFIFELHQFLYRADTGYFASQEIVTHIDAPNIEKGVRCCTHTLRAANSGGFIPASYVVRHYGDPGSFPQAGPRNLNKLLRLEATTVPFKPQYQGLYMPSSVRFLSEIEQSMGTPWS